MSLREVAKAPAKEGTKAPKWWELLPKREGKNVYIHNETLNELDMMRKELKVRTRSDAVYLLIWYYHHPYDHPAIWHPERRRYIRPRHNKAAEEKVKWWMTKKGVPLDLRPLYLKVALQVGELSRHYSGLDLKLELEFLKLAWIRSGLDKTIIKELTNLILT